MKTMEHVLDWLLEGLQSPQSSPKLAWGEETARLAPTLAGCTGLPFDEAPPKKDAPAPPPGFVSKHNNFSLLSVLYRITHQIPFLPVVQENKAVRQTDHTNVSSLVVLSPEETSKFRKVAKEHGRTVTVLTHAFLAAAEVETALRTAVESADTELYEKTLGVYEQATHFLFGFTFVNHVCRLVLCVRICKFTSLPSVISFQSTRRFSLPTELPCSPLTELQWCGTCKPCATLPLSTRSQRRLSVTCPIARGGMESSLLVALRVMVSP